jgi:pre-rRNA-processing protein TSR4
LGGTPLAFQTDDIYRKLFPVAKATSKTVTGAAFTVSIPPRRQYDVVSVDHCPICGKGRVFECQLMPHLINFLRTTSQGGEREGAKQTLEERQKEVERLIKGLHGGVSPNEVTGQEWGTCLIFVCEDDCCVEKNEKGEFWEARSCWREELVLVQWEL